MNERILRAIVDSSTWGDLLARLNRAEYAALVARARRAGCRNTRRDDPIDLQFLQGPACAPHCLPPPTATTAGRPQGEGSREE